MGAKAQGIGPSRGGRTTKIHALTHVLGQPDVLLLTPGNAAEIFTAPAVLAEAPGRIRRLAADKGYDADWLRAALREKGSSRASAVGGRGSATTSAGTESAGASSFDRLRMRATYNCLKDFRRIATRYDKLAGNYASYASAVALAAIIAFWC
ncbi:transposase [Methylobacterium brachiatum]